MNILWYMVHHFPFNLYHTMYLHYRCSNLVLSLIIIHVDCNNFYVYQWHVATKLLQTKSYPKNNHQQWNNKKVICGSPKFKHFPSTVNSLEIPGIFYSTRCRFHDTIKIDKMRIYIHSSLLNFLPNYKNFNFKNFEVMIYVVSTK